MGIYASKTYIVSKEILSVIKMPQWLANKNCLSDELVDIIVEETPKVVKLSTEEWLPKSQIKIEECKEN